MESSTTNVYRLKSENKTGQWQLPIKNTFAEKGKQGLKRLCYVRGSDSYFYEDQKGDFKEEEVWIEEGVLFVEKKNKVLNKLLQAHPLYDKAYHLVDEEKDLRDELSKFKLKDEATERLGSFDKDQIMGTSIMIFGLDAVNWHYEKSRVSLRKYLETKPQEFLNRTRGNEYQTNQIAALSFNKQIIQHDMRSNTIVWNDAEKGLVLSLAVGQNPLKEFSSFLLKGNGESKKVLDTIIKKSDKVS